MTGDDVQDANGFKDCAEPVAEKTEVDKRNDSKAILLIGNDKWPFAIPLAWVNDRWLFVTKAGIEELLNRRIGANEEDTSLVCQA